MNPKRPFEVPGAETAPRFPSCDEIERHLLVSRQLRAEATRTMLDSAGRVMARRLGPARARLARWRQRRETADA